MRWVKLDFESWNRNENKNKNKNELVNEIKFSDDERFKKALIRNTEFCRAENVNKRVNANWLKWVVFVIVYKQRAFLFEMCRFEIQKNQKFSRSFVNFRSFDFDEFDLSSLSIFRWFEDSLARNTLNVDEREIFVNWEHDDQLTLEFRDENELRNDIDENDYLTILFLYLRHHCLSVRVCWEAHKMLHENDRDEDDDESDDENDDEKTKTWCE